MSVKEHYDNHLAHFYSWMMGDFDEKKDEFISFCRSRGILPRHTGVALDLGAGNGIQSVALAELGFKVKALDFSAGLLSELRDKKGDLPIETIEDDLKNFRQHLSQAPELIVCWGDTLSHLGSCAELARLIKDVKEALTPGGRSVLSFRDYSNALEDTGRFIPVKSDSNRILTCCLEYSDHRVRVTDLLYEKEGSEWVLKKSSYSKLRVSQESIAKVLLECGLDILSVETLNRMITMVVQKQ